MTWILDVGSGHNPNPSANIFLDRTLKAHIDRGYRKTIIKENMILGDALHLPFKNKSMELIVSNHVIEHTDNPYKFIEECKRVGKSIRITAPGLIHEVIKTILFVDKTKAHKWVYLPNGNWITSEKFWEARPKYTTKQRIWIKTIKILPRKIRLLIFGVFSYILNEYCQNLDVSAVDFKLEIKNI